MKKVRSFKGKIVAVKRVKKNNVAFSGRENINHAYPEKVLDFYLVTECNKYYLFTQRCTMAVYNKFKNGLYDYQIRNFNQWKRNPRVSKTIDKIPELVIETGKYRKIALYSIPLWAWKFVDSEEWSEEVRFLVEKKGRFLMKNLTFVHGKSFKKPMMSWIRIQDIIGFLP